MAESKTEVANLALGHLGISDTISDLQTERSKEALACKRFFDESLRLTLRDFDWPHARQRAVLALYQTAPNDDWDYAYTYPSEAVALRKIWSGARNDSRQSRVAHEIKYDSVQGKIIQTDMRDAVILYTRFHDQVELWPSDFAMALSYRLAYYITPQIAGIDSRRLKQEMLSLYRLELGQARANAGNEEQPDEEVESEFIRERGGY